jgi:hypothetical protein
MAYLGAMNAGNVSLRSPSFVPATMSAAAPMSPPAQQQMDLMWQQRWQQEVEQAAEERARQRLAWAPPPPPSPQQQMWQQDEQAAEEWVRQMLARAPPPSPQQQQQARAWLSGWAEQQRAGIIADMDGDRDGDYVCIHDWIHSSQPIVEHPLLALKACFCIWTVPWRTDNTDN